MSEWRNIYQRLVQLEKVWSVHEQPEINRELFRTSVLLKRSDAEVEREFAYFGVKAPPAAQKREARALSSALAGC
jgi:hypothetical protein